MRLPSRRIARVRTFASTPLFLAHSWLCLAIALLVFFWSRASVLQAMLVYPACVVFGLLCLWVAISWRAVRRGWTDPYFLFISAILAFNGGQILLEIVRLNGNGLLRSKFDNATLLTSIGVVTLGLASVHWGAMLALYHRPARTSLPPAHAPGRNNPGRLIAWCLLAIGIVATVPVMRENMATVSQMGYIGLYSTQTKVGSETTAAVLSVLVAPACLFLIALSKRRWKLALVPAAVLFLYSVLQFSLGGRATATAQLVAGAWLYNCSVRRIPRAALLVAGVVLIVALPVIGIVRHSVGEDRTSMQAFRAGLRTVDNPVVALLSEAGSSTETIAYTTELVPSERPFDMGTSYAYGAFAVIPNFFWAIHPSSVHGSLSRWLVTVVEPGTASRSGGLGFSFLAEAYMNFSWPGVVLISALLGFGFVRLATWAESSGDPLKLALLASCLVPILIFPRAESHDVFRFFVWYAVFPYFAIAAPKWFRRHRKVLHR